LVEKFSASPGYYLEDQSKKICVAFSLGQVTQMKHGIFATLIVPWYLLAASTIFLLNAKSYWTRGSKSRCLRIVVTSLKMLYHQRRPDRK
jgi:hypothetical protein